MNNKGQVLIIFVIFLPILLMILGFTIDFGLLSIEKRKISNNTYDAVEFYINNLNDIDIKNKSTKLLESNLNDIDIKIIDNNEYVEITVIKNRKCLYNILSRNQEIKIVYKGFKESKEVIKG